MNYNEPDLYKYDSLSSKCHSNCLEILFALITLAAIFKIAFTTGQKFDTIESQVTDVVENPL